MRKSSIFLIFPAVFIFTNLATAGEPSEMEMRRLKHRNQYFQNPNEASNKFKLAVDFGSPSSQTQDEAGIPMDEVCPGGYSIAVEDLSPLTEKYLLDEGIEMTQEGEIIRLGGPDQDPVGVLSILQVTGVHSDSILCDNIRAYRGHKLLKKSKFDFSKFSQ